MKKNIKVTFKEYFLSIFVCHLFPVAFYISLPSDMATPYLQMSIVDILFLHLRSIVAIHIAAFIMAFCAVTIVIAVAACKKKKNAGL